MSSIMDWFRDNDLALWTMLVGVASAVPCGILGCYLVLRRLSLLGDAISHAVLPGLAIAFVLTGSLSSWPMAVGAGILGVLTAYLTQVVHERAGIPEDASMGVVFTSLFAIGVLIITRAAAGADLDPGCVLYGLIEFTALDTVSFQGLEVPRVLVTLAPVLLLTVGFVSLLWKELKIISFDPALARAIGLRVALVHYLFMAMVAGVTVASFEAVGSILVIAMLIVPGTTAHLLSDRLGGMMAWSVLVSIISAVGGYLFAVWWNTSVAGMMSVVAGACFTLAVFLSPKHGLASQGVRRFRLALRLAREDLLAELYRREETPDREIAPGFAATGWVRYLAFPQLVHRAMIGKVLGKWQLTERGRARAIDLVRTHRLWETYLSSRLGLPPDHLHDPADRVEHHINPELRARLASELGNPPEDPHGRPIP
jgi:manganese/zinc/iron transport system permease protein